MSDVFREKKKVAVFVYIKVSPFRDAEGSSQLRSCLYDEIINTAPRIGDFEKLNCIYNSFLEE